MSDWIQQLYTSDRGWNHVERIVDIPGRSRLPGTEQERTAAELTRDALEAAGARDAHLQEFDIKGWERGSSELTHPESGTTHECFAVQRSPSTEATGELVDLGHGEPEAFESTDVDGKVVMITSGAPEDYHRWVPRIESYLRAVDRGAVGFVVRNHAKGCLYRGGNARKKDGSPIGEIPAVGVSYEVGYRLRRRFEGDPITVAVEADIGDAISQNVVAELGPDTDERVIVSSHVDATDASVESAGDNAVGLGTLVEVANGLSLREDELETRVQLIGFGAEVMGLIGSAKYAAETDRETIKFAAQNDGIARGPNLSVLTNGRPDLQSQAREAAERMREPISVDDGFMLSSDNWNFAKYGIPTYYFGSESADGVPRYGITAENVFTPLDTLDKLDRRDLRRHAIWETELVTELARESSSAPHRDREYVEEQLAADGQDFEDWVFPVV